METKEVNKLINKLYAAVENSGWSAHKYYGTDWAGLMQIRDIVNAVLPQGWAFMVQEVFGYTRDNHCKDYLFTVEHTETGERIIDCNVRAYAAGTMQDIWSAYDCTATFYKHEN